MSVIAGYEVAVVGGGLAGLVTALRLAKRGVRLKPRNAGAVIARVGFRVPKVRGLSLRLGNTVQRNLEFSIVRDHG